MHKSLLSVYLRIPLNYLLLILVTNLCLQSLGNPGSPFTQFIPQTIPGLVSWLKADSISAMDGSVITNWADSFNSNTMIGRAVYHTNRLNGFPALSFDGTNQHFAGTNFLVLGSNYTIFIVASKASTRSATELSLLNGSNPTYYAYRDVNFHHNFFTSSWQGANSGTGTAAVPDTKALAIESFLSGTHGTFQFINGVCGGETGPASYSVSGRIVIGAQSPTSSFYDGDIAEVLIYTNTLSSDDHSVVVKYLLQKYLPGPHITFVGDSLTFGENAASSNSYPCQVMSLIPPQKRFVGVNAENLGNQGESFYNPANQFLSRLHSANRTGNEIVVFWYGANDLLLYDTNTIFTHFFDACQFLRNQGVKVVLVDNIPRGPNGGGGTNTWMSAQNLAAMERKAGTNMYDAFVDLTADPVLGTTNIWTNSLLMNIRDQTHLTALGYSYVATNVYKALEPLLQNNVAY